MTAARQLRKQHGASIAAFALLLLALSLCPPPLRAATTEKIVADWHTGLAIGGYDPVAFYMDGKPVPGSPDVELHYAGAIWRFSNVGNREAFAARPDVTCRSSADTTRSASRAVLRWLATPPSG